jgi:hypothetical protein
MTSQLITAPAEADAPPAWATKRRHRVTIFFAGVTGTVSAVDSCLTSRLHLRAKTRQ